MSSSKEVKTLVIITVFSDTYNMSQQTGSVTPVDSNAMTIWGEFQLRPELPSVSVYKHIAVLSHKPTGKTRIDNPPGLVPLNAGIWFGVSWEARNKWESLQVVLFHHLFS